MFRSIRESNRVGGARGPVRAALACLTILAAAGVTGGASAQPTAKTGTNAAGSLSHGNAAPDLPPGLWSDNVEHHLSDYKGKVLVLFFFDVEYLDGPQDLRTKAKLFDLFRDRPVAFLGVATGHRDITLTKGMINQSGIAAPIYFDNIGLMGRRWGEFYTWHTLIIDADGNYANSFATPAELEKTLKDVKWKYRDSGYDRKLDSIVEQLEWNRYESAMRQLRSTRKSTNKDLAASAEKLYQDVHAEGEKWKADAEAAVESEPAKAFDLYVQLAAVFPGEDLGKAAEAPLKTLKADKKLQDELAARAMFDKLYTAVPRARWEQRLDVADYCESISKKYPETPTGKRAHELWSDLMGAKRGLP